MSEYRVKLDIYNGPLDLLLYLIRRNEVDIHDIPISVITEQYLGYLDMLKQFDIDVAGEFIVMAATLMEIKSAMLIPRAPAEAQEGEEDTSGDPRVELVRQLLEYKKFKDLAGTLAAAAEEQSAKHTRSQADIKRLRREEREQQELDMESLHIWDLFEAFNRLMQATLAGRRQHHVIQDDTPIDVYETEILYRAQKETPLTFAMVFEGCQGRAEMVGMFLALLELIRQKLVRIEQENAFAAIYVFALTDIPAEQAVAHAVSRDATKLPSALHPNQHDDEESDMADAPEQDIPSEESPQEQEPAEDADSQEVETKRDSSENEEPST